MTLETATGTARDKQDKSFVKSPTRFKHSAQEVVVSNTQNNPIPVDPTTRGTPSSEYNEIQLLTDVTGIIINKTMTADVTDLEEIFVSGDNIGHYIVEINGATKYKVRTWWGDFNNYIKLSKENLVVGDNVKIIVENKTNRAAFFNATLKFSEL